ncbi:peptidase C14 [Microbacterium sp. p3-SID336]|uniref:peptidase C14 n=1 Tax=Microbacterium sp. p3-SID336 TaxID=2916212 RepID=UPI0021A7874B|nr:peptidase C14 [Microbacterium sp. p3-SID336]MCT1477127.1 peptidase C14 [Microbacterium sp. p3-SID336]
MTQLDNTDTAALRSRRMLLAGFGAAALGGVAAVGAPAAAQASGPAVPLEAAGSKSVANGGTATALAARKGKDGDLVRTAGYAAPGDGGGGLYRFVKKDGPAANGGTVLAGAKGGVWVLVHGGVVEFRQFGIMDASVPADDALDAMVLDPAVHRVEAHTDLNFVRRHRFSRSNIAFDFGNHLMTTEGIENAGKDDPFAAVMFFRGEVTEAVQEARLGETVPDLADVFPVADSSFFAVGEWYAAEVNALSGRWERELQRLVQVTQIVDGTHIRVNYKNGWPLGKDRTMTWRHVVPVQDVRVSNLRFLGGGTDEYTGSHPLAFEYAVRCDVDHIDGTATFWPLIQRRWNTYFTTESCTLKNPTSVTWGGAGYLTQQIYCLYGYVANCHTANARHLNDFTASAYCLVENCHGDGDDQGPFVTHGQYEHDLTYTGNSGLMTFANSGAAWGSAAKRITVRKHVCSWFVARVRITDLTLEDVQVIGKPSLSGSGMLWVNADGAQLRGCTASDTLILTQASDNSARPTVIADSHFTFTAPGELTNATVATPVTFVDTVLTGVGGMKVLGAGAVTFRGSTLSAADDAAPIATSSERLRFEGSTLRNVRIAAATAGRHAVEVAGSDVAWKGGTGVERSGEGELHVTLTDSTLRAEADAVHVSLAGGKTHYRAVGNRFEGGSLDLRDDAFGSASTLLHTGNVEAGVTRAAFPAAGDRVVDTANLVV